jgi:hypothetical protein
LPREIPSSAAWASRNRKSIDLKKRRSRREGNHRRRREDASESCRWRRQGSRSEDVLGLLLITGLQMDYKSQK